MEDKGDKMKSKSFFKHRCSQVFKITICILLDALIFCEWILVTWGTDSLAKYLASKGVNEFCANSFKWTSSVIILILAIVYIITDLMNSFSDILSHNKGE